MDLLRHLSNVLFRSPLLALTLGAPLLQLYVLRFGPVAFTAAVLAGAGLFALLLHHASDIGGYVGVDAIAWLGATGLAAFSLVLWAAAGFASRSAGRTRHARFLAVAFLAVVGLEILNGRFLRYTGTRFSLTWDHRVALLDALFGFSPAFAMGRFLLAFPWLQNFAFLAYNSLLLGLTALVALQSRRSLRAAASTLLLFVTVGLLGGALYAVMPVAGPRAAFPSEYPSVLPRLGTNPLLPSPLPPSPRNGMPSLHTAWVIFLFLSARKESAGIRIAYLLLMVGTILATLGTGEHYLLDLIAVLPLAFGISLIDSTTYNSGRAWALFALLYGCTVAWVMALRFAGAELYSSGVLLPLAGVVTLAGSILLRNRLISLVPAQSPVSKDIPAQAMAGRG